MGGYVIDNPILELVVATTLLTFTILYYYATSTFNYWKSKNVFHLKPVPLIGNFLPVMLFKRSAGEFFQDCYNSTKDPFMGLYIFRRPYLVLRDPELVKSVLIKDFQYFSDRSHADAKDIDPIGTRHLFAIHNPEWKAMRVKLSPIFTSGKLKTMYPLLVEIGGKLNSYIKETSKPSFEVKETCSRYAVDAIVSVAFGIDANSFQKSSLAEFHDVALNMFKFTPKRALELTSFFFVPALVKLLGFKFFGERGSKFIREVFWQSMLHREQNGVQRNDLIDMLIKLKNSGSIEDVEDSNSDALNEIKFDGDTLVAQAGVFFAAGYESVSSGMAFILYHLAGWPQIQERLREEVHRVLSKANGELTFESLEKLKYMDQVIKESLRLYPPLPFLDRVCVKDYVIPGTNVRIEKGTAVIIPLFGLHRDPHYWPNPDKFDPERFSEENIKNIVPHTHMPFGEGPHNCIGGRYAMMKLKVGIVNIIKDFEVELARSEDFCGEKTVPLDPKGVLPAPINPINLKFKKCQRFIDRKINSSLSNV